MANAREVARKIVDDIAADISDRKDIGDEFDMIDSDVKSEMINLWLDTIEEHVRRYRPE
jgi:hypothetical protein